MITSTSNDKVKRLTQLQTSSRHRREAGLFVSEGIRIIREIPAKDLRELYCSESYFSKNKKELEELCRDKGIQPDVTVLSDNVFKKVSDTQTPQGIIAVASQRKYSLEDMTKGDDFCLVVMENIQNPGNLGALLRTGEATGMNGFILSRDSVDIYNPKVIRASMGTFLRVPFVYVEDLCETIEKLKSFGTRMFATHLEGKENCFTVKFPPKMALLIGNEGNGLSENVTNYTDEKILIPMEGKVESLNAAIAGSVLFYEVLRQKKYN